MKQKITLIKLFVLTGNLIIPVYSIGLYVSKLRTAEGLLMCLFISGCIIERAWETFSTSKERKRDELHGDWTLVAVTGSYLVLFFLFTTEFYSFVQTINIYVTGFGFLVWLVALRLRFWGMAALGKQWAVHAVGAQKIHNVRLIKLGPYRYMRHPIYSAIILEEISFPIIANAPYSLLFALFVCVPLVIIRSILEEKASVRRFGADYLKYKTEVGRFFPTSKFLKRR